MTATLQKANETTFSTYMTGDIVKKKVNEVIGNERDGAKFISTIVGSVQANPALRECTNSSLLSSALTAYSLNLSPSPQLGQIYLIPYKNNKTGMVEAQLQIGYKSYIQLAIRSGYYKKINVVAIKEGELIKFDPLNEEIEVKLIEDDIKREHTPTIGYYGMFEYLNGFKKAIYWSKEKMLAHADRYSKSFSAKIYKDIQEGKIKQTDMWKYSSPWYTMFDDMAFKTLIKQLLSKWGVLSTDMQMAFDKDNSVINEDNTTTYVDEDEDYQIDSIPDVKSQIKEVIKEQKAKNTPIEIPTSQTTDEPTDAEEVDIDQF